MSVFVRVALYSSILRLDVDDHMYVIIVKNLQIFRIYLKILFMPLLSVVNSPSMFSNSLRRLFSFYIRILNVIMCLVTNHFKVIFQLPYFIKTNKNNVFIIYLLEIKFKRMFVSRTILNFICTIVKSFFKKSWARSKHT